MEAAFLNLWIKLTTDREISPSEMADAHRSGLISIVLCTYDNHTQLQETLDAFSRLCEPQKFDWELIAVDNNSTDRTKEVVRSFEGRLPIRYVFEPTQGLSNARNTGLSAARGEFLVFTDDDIIPSEDWLRAYAEGYRDRSNGYFFGGPVSSRFEGRGVDPELRSIAPWSVQGLDLGNQNRLLERDELFLGANWGVPARHLSEVGAFDSTLGLNPKAEKPRAGEESDLMDRLSSRGINGWYLSEARVDHIVPTSKCGLDHIADRAEANAHGSVTSKLRAAMVGNRAPTSRHILAVGKELSKFVLHGLTWPISRAIGRKWKKPYVRWRGARGSLRGYWNEW